MKNNDLNFSFYEKERFEDAPPYLSKNAIAVCDGMGGSGRHHHNIEPSSINEVSKIKAAILPECLDATYDKVIEEYFEPVLKNPNVKRTSAFWGSRIAMLRYRYYLDEHTHVRDHELADFILKGLTHAKKVLIDKSEKTGDLDFPTTLVGIRVKKEHKSEIEIEVDLAGDSRAYALTSEGLKILAKDQEDEFTGYLKNYLAADSPHCFIANYARSLPKPCLLFVCSDGLFNNYKDIELEHLLLSYLEESESMEEWKNKIAAFYKKHKTDDVSMSLLSFGFSDFESIKSHFKKRGEDIAPIYGSYVKNKKIFDIFYNDLFGYETKEKLAKKLLPNIGSVCEDISSTIDTEATKKLLGERIGDVILNDDVPDEEKVAPFLEIEKHEVAQCLNEAVLSYSYEETFDQAFIERHKETFAEFDECKKVDESISGWYENYMVCKNVFYSDCDNLVFSFGIHIAEKLSYVPPFSELDMASLFEQLGKNIKNLTITEEQLSFLADTIQDKSLVLNIFRSRETYKNELEQLSDYNKKTKENAERYKKLIDKVLGLEQYSSSIFNAKFKTNILKPILEKSRITKELVTANRNNLAERAKNYYASSSNISSLIVNRFDLGNIDTCIDHYFSEDEITILRNRKNDGSDILGYPEYENYNYEVYSFIFDDMRDELANDDNLWIFEDNPSQAPC